MVDRTYRPDVPVTHPDESEHRRQLAVRANSGLPKDGSQPATHPVILKSYTVAGLPDASLWTDGVVIVSDEAGGPTLAISDGTNWLRASDGATVT